MREAYDVAIWRNIICQLAGALLGDRLDLPPRLIRRRTPHSVGLRAKIALLRLEDVRHPDLRIPVDDREPGALHLHHYPVSGLEAVTLGVQVDRDRGHLVRYHRFRLFERIAE